ncbi:hypothetical protein ACXR2T_08030 [Leucobacter sp. HY1910]
MKQQTYTETIALINDATPSVRGTLDDNRWERLLLDQGKEMIRRLKENDPLDVRLGIGRGIAVFSLYEVVLSTFRENGRDTSLVTAAV